MLSTRFCFVNTSNLLLPDTHYTPAAPAIATYVDTEDVLCREQKEGTVKLTKAGPGERG